MGHMTLTWLQHNTAISTRAACSPGYPSKTVQQEGWAGLPEGKAMTKDELGYSEAGEAGGTAAGGRVLQGGTRSISRGAGVPGEVRRHTEQTWWGL